VALISCWVTFTDAARESQLAAEALAAQQETSALLHKRAEDAQKSQLDELLGGMSANKSKKALLAKYALRWHKVKWVRLLRRGAALEAELADKEQIFATLAQRDAEVASLRDELAASAAANKTLRAQLETSEKQARGGGLPAEGGGAAVGGEGEWGGREGRRADEAEGSAQSAGNRVGAPTHIRYRP
jgi:hypothetical protein